MLDWWLYKNPVYQALFAKPVSSPILAFGQRRMEERLNGEENDREKSGAATELQDPALREKDLGRLPPSKPDFLSRFLGLRESQPEVVTDKQLLAYLFVSSFQLTWASLFPFQSLRSSS